MIALSHFSFSHKDLGVTQSLHGNVYKVMNYEGQNTVHMLAEFKQNKNQNLGGWQIQAMGILLHQNLHRKNWLLSIQVFLSLQYNYQFCYRKFAESHWCLEEFAQAYHQMVQGRINYIIIVMVEKPSSNQLPAELETYLTTHTYIDARNHAGELELIRKRIRFAMPKIPRIASGVRKRTTFT